MPKQHKIFTGTANPILAQKVCKELNIDLGKIKVDRFSDGEINIQIQENVRGCDVFIIQSTCTPTNESLMELLLICDALKRASAKKITAIIPYFGYSRQDRRVRSIRVPISSKLVADMLSVAGVSSVMTVDIHAEQIQGFFNIPVDNLYATHLFVDDIKKQNYTNPMIVSPDVGGVVRARVVAKKLDTDLSIIDKRRPEANKAEVMNIIGDVKGRTCIMIDDMVDTAGTLVSAAKALKQNGALKVCAYATHPVLSGKAYKNIQAKGGVDELIVTNSIPLSATIAKTGIVRILDLYMLISKAIRRVLDRQSVSELS